MFHGLIGVAAKIATLTLLVAPTTAIAEPNQIKIVTHQGLTISMPKTPIEQQVPTDLQWTQEQITGAKRIIEIQTKRLEQILDNFRSHGADRVVSKLDDVLNEMDLAKYYPKFNQKPYVSLLAYKGNKRVTGRINEGWPEEPGLGSNLIKLDSLDCSLKEFHWFNPFTWAIHNTCEIQTPKPKKFLRGELISSLYTGTPEHAFQFTLMDLKKLVSDRVPYRVRNNKIVPLDPNYRFLGNLKSIKLQDWEYCYGYEITFGKGAWDLTFTVTARSIKEIASHMALQESGQYDRPPYFSPWMDDWYLVDLN